MTQQPAGAVLRFTIGDRLRKAREFAGYGQDQGGFAALVGVSRGTISNYEREEVEHYKPIVLREWARVAGVSLRWLETGEGSPTSPEPPRSNHGQERGALAELTEAKRARSRRGGSTGRYFTRAA